MRCANVVKVGVHDAGLETIINAKRVQCLVPVLLLDQIKLFDVLGKTYPQENPRGSVRSVLEGLIEHALGPYFAETTLSQACDREEAIWDFEVSVTRRIAVVN